MGLLVFSEHLQSILIKQVFFRLQNVTKQATGNISGHIETAFQTGNNTIMNIRKQMKLFLIFHCFLNLQIAGVPQFRSLSDMWCYNVEQTAVLSMWAHEEITGPCGRVCLKGPGDVCEGQMNVYGQCGESLHWMLLQVIYLF